MDSNYLTQVRVFPHMLRLGIIGCGRVTTMFHLKAIEASGVVELVSISDMSGEQLAEVKSATGVSHACGDYMEMLARADVEAVAINTPPRFHEEMTLQSLGAGKHVLCEKPLVTRTDAANALSIVNFPGAAVLGRDRLSKSSEPQTPRTPVFDDSFPQLPSCTSTRSRSDTRAPVIPMRN